MVDGDHLKLVIIKLNELLRNLGVTNLRWSPLAINTKRDKHWLYVVIVTSSRQALMCEWYNLARVKRCSVYWNALYSLWVTCVSLGSHWMFAQVLPLMRVLEYRARRSCCTQAYFLSIHVRSMYLVGLVVIWSQLCASIISCSLMSILATYDI